MGSIHRGIRDIQKAALYCLIVGMTFVILVPLLNMVATSFRPASAIYTETGLIPSTVSIENYLTMFRRTAFVGQMVNSSVYTIAVIMLTILLASFAGYGFSRYRGPVFSFLLYMLIVVLVFPLILLLIPMYMTFRLFNLINTRTAIILAYLAFQLPFSIWMLRGFFDTIPRELEEAGLIDGCTQVQALFRIILPISRPGLATVAIFCFIRVWNEFMMASVIVPNPEITTIMVGLQTFIQQTTVEWGRLLAAAAFAAVPAFLFIMFAQKHLVQGITSGAVKS